MRSDEDERREQSPAREAHDALETALFEIKRVIVGQEAMLERVIVALLAGGHVLLEGVPGLAKTLTVKTVSDVLGGSFKRLQFTPDLVPADLVGTRIYRADTGGFDTELGPVFCNFLLADEINRAPAKVQSALLEVMQERQVTIGHESHRVPAPFLVMATQNPIESEGTYALPEAQVDRFMFKLVVDYPETRDEVAVVERSLDARRARAPGAHARVARRSTSAPRRTRYVDRRVMEYAVALTTATREPGEHGWVEFGASPRGSINLIHAARALALLRARDYVLPVDVRDLARDVLRHRIVLTYEALASGVDADRVLDDVLRAHADAADRARARAQRDGRALAATHELPRATRAGRPGAAAAGRSPPTSPRSSGGGGSRSATRTSTCSPRSPRRAGCATCRRCWRCSRSPRCWSRSARPERTVAAQREEATVMHGHRHVGLDARQGRPPRPADRRARGGADAHRARCRRTSGSG